MGHRSPLESGTERQVLVGVLDSLRSAAVNKVSGLTDDQSFRAVVPPSTLTPAGIIKHLTGVERFWFSIDFAAHDVEWPWTDEDPHGNFDITPGDTLTDLVTGYVEETERSRAIVDASSLDDTARGPGQAFTLRYAITHMIDETARHCGHLDLLCERIDGRIGQAKS